MKKHHGVHVLMFIVVASVSLCLAQTRAIDKYGETLFEGRPFFTDSALYNSYDLGGSPLGLFDKGSPRFNAEVGYRYSGLGDRSGQYWNAPLLTVGTAGQLFLRGFYVPRVMSDESGANEISLSQLHRFGFVLASQGTSGALRTAISFAGGFWDRQEWKNSDNARLIVDIEKIRFDIGSQLHPRLRLGVFVGINGRLDTLVAPYHADRSGYAALPLGGNLDFGGEGFPVRSNIDFSYAWSRFVYTAWERGGLQNAPSGAGLPSYQGGDANAILNDSVNLFWTTRVNVPLQDGKFALKPGLVLGLTINSGDMHVQEPDDDALKHLINIGSVRPNSEYSLTGFWFGVGSGFEAADLAVNTHVEYTLAAMSLQCGSYYTGRGVKNSRTLHNVSIGASANINKFVEMPVVVTPRAAWFASGTARMYGAARSRLNLDPFNNEPGMSKHLLYEPQKFLDGFERVSGFTVGVDGQALDGQVDASVWASFLSSSVNKDGGLEIGAKLGFLLK
jgi:hypothetical protein